MMNYYNQNQIINVNGENGARAYQMMPNSSALLLDTSAPIIWLAQTDGAGYKSLTAYDITPHKEPEPINYNDIISRLEKVEEKLNEQSNNADAKSKPTKQ